MTLPIKVIDRLFERLGATYGASWTRQWVDVPMNDVKTAWAHELHGYSTNLQLLAWALENLPERCPNVIEFRNLCRRAPAPDVPRLPETKVDPERVKQELDKLSSIRASVTSGSSNGKDWARRIIGRMEAGERINPASLKCAKDALQMNKKAGE